MATVYVPTPLRQATGGRSKLTASGRTVKELLDGLERTYPGIRQQLCDETGEIRSFINVFVNGTEIRQLEGLSTPVQDADEVSIIPAMAGGLDEDNGGGKGFGLRVSKKKKRGNCQNPKPYSPTPPPGLPNMSGKVKVAPSRGARRPPASHGAGSASAPSRMHRTRPLTSPGRAGTPATPDEVYDTVLEVIGRTPLVRLHKVTRGIRADLVAKLEDLNPGGSVKDRIGPPMIEDAERRGLRRPGGAR